jgi:DNA-binding CsgD family transcriptional regulator
MVSERVVCREFVGRVVELEHLRARRKAAAEGRGGLVLVAGEPGIGKSRLVQEFCAHLTPTRHHIAGAACREFAERPLAPLVQVLRGPDGSPAFDERAPSRDEQLAAILAAFDRIAERGTAILTLDDLHWADASLVATLAVLAERAAARRALIVGTYRDGEIVATHPLFIPFGRLLRREEVSLLSLEPLDADDGERLLRGALAGDTELGAETVRDVLRRSGGNPLFAEELLRHVVDRQRSGAARSAHSLPLTLHAVVRERLNRCSERDRLLLAQASLFGRRFRADLLAEIFDEHLEALVAPLQRLCELQLIDVRHGDPHAFQFRHALTRDAVYGEMLPTQTRALHLRIAKSLEARAKPGELTEIVAHNFWEAGEFAAAAPYCERAGDEAYALHAYEDAAAWFERAAAGFTGDDGSIARVLAKAGDGWQRSDAIDRVAATRERSADAYIRSGDFERAVEQRNYVLGSLANDGRSEAARTYGEATLALLPSSAAELRARVLIRLAAMEAAIRRSDAALCYLAEVDEAALDRGHPSALEYYAVRSSVHAQRTEVAAWRTCFTQALAISDAIDVAGMRRWLPSSIAVQALNLGEVTTARDYQLQSLRVAQVLRFELNYSFLLLAQIELRAGNVPVAQSYFERAKAAREYLPRLQRAIVGMSLATVLGDRDALERLLELEMVDKAIEAGNPFGMIEAACAFGLGLTELGRTAEALPLLERAAAAIDNPFGLADSIAIMVRCAPRLARSVRPAVAARAAGPEERVNRALLDLLDATLANDPADRRALGERSAAGFGELGWPLFAALALERAGLQDSALDLYRRCGAEGEVRRLGREAYATGGDASTVLTAREHAIVELVASGRGNRATASALNVSEKTIEKSLTAIYAKLGLTSRTELAAYVASARCS